jgi:3-deoxy-D-manno-octulosonic-acid transferase/heptosyltransferase-1
LLRECGIEAGQDRFIAVNPVALWETKLWDQGKFAELAQRIVQEMNVPVVLTGSAAEKPYIDGIQRTMKLPVANLAGETSLRDLAALYRLASLVVTTDSGPMHIAAAVNTPVVALFGPTDPARTGPYGTGHTVVRRGLSCSPCFLKECPSRRCMNEILVDDVFDAVRKKMVEEKERIRLEKEKRHGDQ